MTAADHRRVIAIDGPGAAGKSTVAVAVAEALDAMLFDTGALYRTVTLLGLAARADLDDGAGLARLASTAHIDLRPASTDDGRTSDVLLNGEDVTWAIRAVEIDANVSRVAAHAEVRQALLKVQRDIADGIRAVLVGRDIGTVVLPGAGLKIYLDASPAVRAGRRHAEMVARGEHITEQDVLDDLQRRDRYDSEREVSPLRRADDAMVILTDGRDVADITRQIVDLARAHAVVCETAT